jgi:hypothetical protein
VSRYGDDGMLVMMDYNAFHPRLIAHLSNFSMDAAENPYAYLSKYYFNKSNITEEDIAVAKGFTFKQIYGGIDKSGCIYHTSRRYKSILTIVGSSLWRMDI